MSFGIPPEPCHADIRKLRDVCREEDQADARFLQELLSSCESEVASLRASIVLADAAFGGATVVSDVGRIHRKWTYIAAQAAIASIFHFNDTLRAAQDLLEASNLRNYLDTPTAATQAQEKLRKSFPKFLPLRHATAHAAEILANPGKNYHYAALSKPPVKKPKGTPMTLHNSFKGRTFITTRKGELLEFGVTWDSYNNLNNIYEEFMRDLTPKS